MSLPSHVQAKRVHVGTCTARVEGLIPRIQHPGWFGTWGHEAVGPKPMGP